MLIYNNETKYLVNDLGRTSAVVQTDSKGDEIREMYSYLDRVPAYPTEIIKTNKGNVISAMKIDYEQQSNAEDHYTPLKVWKGAVGVAPLNIEYRPDCIYSHYDTHGNPRQVVDKNGKTTCYFWGYNGRHIVAKVENSTYNILLGYGIGTTYSEALPADVEAQLRNDEDENFIIDGEAAPVVRQIYSLCLAGNGPTKIARMLTEQEIPTPGTLEYRRTGSTRRYHPGYECKWATNTVVHLLENREYTGCLVNFKTEKPSYKLKHSIENPPEKQAVFENHHEPIIDRETWERVQELRKQRKRPNRYDEVGLFSGILFCADCGSVMYQQRYQTDKRKQDCYICGSYKKRTADCTAHFIRTDLLTAGVLSNLRKVTSYAAKHEARFMKLLIEQNEDGDRRRNAAKKKELEAAEKRIAELSAIFKRLYEDSVTGRISDERFTELSADYEAEQKELKERAARLREELSKAQEATANAEKFMNVVRRHTTIEELTPTLLREFVEKIVVHESVALDGKRRGKLRRQEIEIYYSFVGKVELPDT